MFLAQLPLQFVVLVQQRLVGRLGNSKLSTASQACRVPQGGICKAQVLLLLLLPLLWLGFR
jgi:hypothetical protein